MTRLLTQSLLACLTVSVAAQAPLTPYAPPMNVRSWPDKVNHPGEYGRMVSASISNFGYPDTVFLAGDDVMLMIAPALLFQIEPLAGTLGFSANDLCRTTDPGVNAHLAICGATGLSLWSRGTQTLAPVAGSSWNGARTVREARGQGVVVGISANRTSIVRADLRTGVELPAWPVTDLLAVAPFDFDNDGADEIGVVTTSGIQVREIDGTISQFYGGYLDSAFAERAPTPIGDSLAVSCKVTGYQTQWLASVHRLWQDITQLGPRSVTGLTIADADDNGWHDAVMMATATPSFDALLSLGATQVPWFEYGPQGGFEVQMATSAPPTMSWMGDTNGDSRTESISAAGSEFAFVDSPFTPGAVTGVRYSAVNFLGENEEPIPDPAGKAHLKLYLLHTAIPAAATHLEMHMYSWDPHSGLPPAYRSAWGTTIPCTQLHAPDYTWSEDFAASEIYQGAAIFMLRYVEMVGGDVVHVWPPYTGAATADAQLNGYLQGLPGMFASQGGIGGVPTGGVTVITRIPPVSPATGFDGDGD